MKWIAWTDTTIDAASLVLMTELAALCRKTDRCSLSFPGLKEAGQDAVHFFAAFEGAVCAGAMAAYLVPASSDDPRRVYSYEITAFVHPDYRRRGIFRALMELFLQKEGLRWKSPDVVLLSDHCCPAAAFAALAWQMKALRAEYLMKWDLSHSPSLPSPVRIVRCQKRSILAKIYARTFQTSGRTARAYVQMVLSEETSASGFLLIRGRTLIGSGYVILSDPESAFLFGFGILPAYQRQGLGFASLQALKSFLPETCRSLTVQVSGENHPARKLYEKAGFVITQQLFYYGWEASF